MALDLSALDSTSSAPVLGDRAPRASLDRFVEDEDQPRFEFDDHEFEDFVADVKARGILQPVIVEALANGLLKIRFGARRLRAARRLSLPDLPYNISEDPRQLDDYSQVSENQQRKNLTPLELAKFVAKRVQAGDSRKVIAERLRLDASAITHLLALIDSPPFLLELYHSGKCRTPVYLYELRKLYGKNASLVEDRCATAEEISRRFISSLAAEINAPTPVITLASAPEDSLEKLENRGQDGEAPSPGESSQPHDRANEQMLVRPVDPTRIKKPQLLGKYRKRDVMVLLNRKPTSSDTVFVRYEDGSGEQEVSISALTLTQLSDRG